jgi:hypothetical protein
MEKDPSGVWFSYSTAAIIADETSPGAQKRAAAKAGSKKF